MQQPSLPNAHSQNPQSKDPTTKKKPPTPQELISHYQAQGLDTQEASVKVIEDLQNVLLRVISANNRSKKDNKSTTETSRKVDVLNNRLAVLDMKMDSKPGYFASFAIGVASGAAFRGIETVWPHVVEGIGQIWTSVTSTTKPSP